MDNNTHGAFMQWKDEKGDIVSAFVDGIPDDCEHDSNGPVLSFNSNGEYYREDEMPNHETDYEAWLKFQTDHKINGGCVSCSKCGKPFSPPMF